MSFSCKPHENRPFATNDRMVQNSPCWRASSLLLFPYWDIKTKASEAWLVEVSFFSRPSAGIIISLPAMLFVSWDRLLQKAYNSGFQLSAVHQSQGIVAGQSLRTNNPLNQSIRKANTCSCRKARENVRERVAISFGFLIGWQKWHKFLLNHSLTKPSRTRFIFDSSVKIALIYTLLNQKGTLGRHK